LVNKDQTTTENINFFLKTKKTQLVGEGSTGSLEWTRARLKVSTTGWCFYPFYLNPDLSLILFQTYRHEYDAPPSGERYFKTTQLNFGPQHPAAHGVLRMILQLDGEVRSFHILLFMQGTLNEGEGSVQLTSSLR